MMICETAVVATYAGTSNKGGNAMGVLFLFLFATFYGGSMKASSYVYCSEIFSTSIRAQGLGISVAGLFASTLLYTQVAPIAFQQVGWHYYLVFIILPLSGVSFLACFLPETKGLALEEIAAQFGDEVAVDISHLIDEERMALDQRLNSIGDELAPSPPIEEVSKVAVLHSEKV